MLYSYYYYFQKYSAAEFLVLQTMSVKAHKQNICVNNKGRVVILDIYSCVFFLGTTKLQRNK